MAKKKAKSKPKKASKSKASKKPKFKRAKAAKKAVKKKVMRKAAKPAKKAAAKKSSLKRAVKPAAKLVQRTKIGEVTHFYSHISVAVVKIENSLKAGDVISIEGATTNLKQKVESMQIDHDKVTEAKKGQEIGMKVIDKVREGDIVYKA